MIEWTEQQQMIRDVVRRFIDAELVPHVDALEHGDMPPYDILRKFYSTFGMAEMQRARFAKMIEREKRGASRPEADAQRAAGERSSTREPKKRDDDEEGESGGSAMTLIPIIELCRHCPGLVTAMGVSVGLTAAAILSKGTTRQKERWALDILTLDKIGAWAITEPGSGSDAFGGMKATAKRTPDGGYLLNGNKTFITNGPYADTIVFICKLEEEGVASRDRRMLHFVLDKGMPGLVQSKPMRKMGLHSSPTGELFLTDVKVDIDRLLGEAEPKASDGRAGAKATFQTERAGVAAMALGMIERALELSVAYAKERVQFGKPIGEFQLIQEKLARMEVARLNVQNLVFRTLELASLGRSMSFAEASAMKLYAARAADEVCQDAVQVFGGNGYMAEYKVEQLARDARVLRIYAGTDEIQITAIARDLLAR